MRIGYDITYCEEFTALLKPGPVFNVGLLTLEAAMAALEDKDHLERYINIVSSERTRIEKELKSKNIQFFNSAGNFVCLSLPTLERAQVIETKMQSVGIFVKSQKGRNNEGVVRITIGRPEDNDKVLDNLTR
jgi:histidinol-phosphate aminotransferase